MGCPTCGPPKRHEKGRSAAGARVGRHGAQVARFGVHHDVRRPASPGQCVAGADVHRVDAAVKQGRHPARGHVVGLRALAAPERSETARRLTDLFVPPVPVTVQLRGKALRFDRRLIHVSANGILMASKNEVIIAGLLDRLVPGQWEYERVLQGNDGREVRPDFTIQTPDGRTVFWEHAGMLESARLRPQVGPEETVVYRQPHPALRAVPARGSRGGSDVDRRP